MGHISHEFGHWDLDGWVSMLAALSKASILTGPRGHSARSTRDPSRQVNLSLALLSISLPRLSKIELLPIALPCSRSATLALTHEGLGFLPRLSPISWKQMNRESISHIVFCSYHQSYQSE